MPVIALSHGVEDEATQRAIRQLEQEITSLKQLVETMRAALAALTSRVTALEP